MKTVFKVIYFYALWYICAVAGREDYHWYAVGLSVFSVLVDYAIYRYPMGAKRYFLFALFLMITGPLMDLGFKQLGLLNWNSTFYPPAIMAIWLFFVVYYPELFKFLHHRLPLAFILGGMAGPLAYYSGHLIGSLQINTNELALGFAFAVAWGCYFALSLKVFTLFNVSSRQ
jgi:hypothetical protein